MRNFHIKPRSFYKGNPVLPVVFLILPHSVLVPIYIYLRMTRSPPDLDTCLASTFLLEAADVDGGARLQFKGGRR